MNLHATLRAAAVSFACAALVAHVVAQGPAAKPPSKSVPPPTATATKDATRDGAKDAAADRPLTDVGRIALEEIELKDDTKYRGLVESQTDRRIVFIEVVRPAGKPTYVVVRPLAADSVVRIKRLPAAERKIVERLVDEARSLLRVEAERMDTIQFKTSRENGRVVYRYEGEWFSLTSTADDESSRRAVVRLEQVFLAYRQMLPPRLAPASRLSVLLFGSLEEYRAHMREVGLDLANPAFYSVRDNRIVAGADLIVFGQQLAKSRAENDAVAKQYADAAAKLPEQLAALNRQLTAEGIAENQRSQEMRAWRLRFQNEHAEARRQIRTIERSNTTKFNRFAEQLLAQLYHEAFHAYIENYVYRHGGADRQMPRWLYEGLAQVFESGQFEADTLRLDAPSAKALAGLQADLRKANPLTIEQLITAGDSPFVASHTDAARASARHYLYSWGLTYYLIFGPTRLDLAKIDRLAAADGTAATRLEQLVGQPITRFDAQWRQAMLALSPNSTGLLPGEPKK
jgi:hypothetical protein